MNRSRATIDFTLGVYLDAQPEGGDEPDEKDGQPDQPGQPGQPTG